MRFLVKIAFLPKNQLRKSKRKYVLFRVVMVKNITQTWWGTRWIFRKDTETWWPWQRYFLSSLASLRVSRYPRCWYFLLISGVSMDLLNGLTPTPDRLAFPQWTTTLCLLEREQRDSGGNRETAAIGNANEILTGFWLKENVQNVDVARLNMNRLDV